MKTNRAPFGHLERGFEHVREAFAENFARRGELGGACCAYFRGEKVVDLWGGIRNKQTGEPWEQDTMVVVHSATKGLAAMTLAIAHSRGWLDYEERVARYWPEFAQQGKEKITVRQLLAHQAGLFAFDEPVDRAAWSPTSIASRSCSPGRSRRGSPARARPTTRSPSGSMKASCCAASTRGIAASDSSSRTRSPRRSARTSTSVCRREIPNSRLATLSPPTRLGMLTGFPLRLTFEAMNRHSNIYRALVTNPGSAVYQDEQRVYARNLEVPSGGGVGTARHRARLRRLRHGWTELGLRPETLDLLAAPAMAPTRGFYDECMKADGIQFSLGFMKSTPRWPFGSAARSAPLEPVVAWLCGSEGRHRLLACDEPDGHGIDRRPARRGAERGALLRDFGAPWPNPGQLVA